MKCAICLTQPPAPTHWNAIRCGHIFCEPCLSTFIEIEENRERQTSCPTCRQPFDVEDEDIIIIYPTFDDEDEASSLTNDRSMSDAQKLEAITLMEQADRLGIESNAADIEAVVYGAESWSVSAKPSSDSLEIVKHLEEALQQLRKRLVYSKRLTSLKAAQALQQAELESLSAQVAMLSTKYAKAKTQRDDALRKKLEVVEQLKEWNERDRQWQERDEDYQAIIRDLTTQKERATPRIIALQTKIEALENQAVSTKATLDECKQKMLRMKKRYLVLKQNVSSCVGGDDDPIHLSNNDEGDDGPSLIIFEPSEPSASDTLAKKAKTQLKKSTPLISHNVQPSSRFSATLASSSSALNARKILPTRLGSKENPLMLESDDDVLAQSRSRPGKRQPAIQDQFGAKKPRSRREGNAEGYS